MASPPHPRQRRPVRRFARGWSAVAIGGWAAVLVRVPAGRVVAGRVAAATATVDIRPADAQSFPPTADARADAAAARADAAAARADAAAARLTAATATAAGPGAGYERSNAAANWVYAASTLLLAVSASIGVLAWRGQQRRRLLWNGARAISRDAYAVRIAMADVRNPKYLRPLWSQPAGDKGPPERRFVPGPHRRAFTRLDAAVERLDASIDAMQTFIDTQPLVRCRNRFVPIADRLEAAVAALVSVRARREQAGVSTPGDDREFDQQLKVLFRPGDNVLDDLEGQMKTINAEFADLLGVYLLGPAHRVRRATAAATRCLRRMFVAIEAAKRHTRSS